jgi:hypothetical protein
MGVVTIGWRVPAAALSDQSKTVRGIELATTHSTSAAAEGVPVKRCFKCDQTKPTSEFYGHPQMADRTLSKCKECTRKDVRENRTKNIEYYRAYDRMRFHRPDRRAQHKRNFIRYAAMHPERRAAQCAVSNAVRDKRLFKQPCEVCGSAKVEAHHDDYSKPLEVRWLCKEHHMAHHWRQAA